VDLGTIIGSKLATSFRIGDLYVTANSVSTAVTNFTDPAIFHSDFGTLENFFLSGSSFRFKYQERYFAVITGHQMSIREAEADQFAITSQDSKTMTTSQSMVFAYNDDLDARLFEFTAPFLAGALGSKLWWPAKEEELFSPTPAAKKVFCVGYPGEANFIEYSELEEELSEFRARPYCVWGEMIEPAMKNRLSFAPTDTSVRSPSGMSGAPVFGIDIVNTEPKCFWAGILANGSMNTFNFIPARQIGQMLEHNKN